MRKMLLILVLFASCTVTPTDLRPSASATEILQTPTALVVNTPAVIGVTQKEYDPTEWELIYDKDMVWKINVSPVPQIWIITDKGDVAFLNGDNWVSFSGQDYGLLEKPNDMAISRNGTVWISGRQAISRYQNRHWDVFPVPNINKTAFTRLAVDPSGKVWMATPLCYCGNSIRGFDGKAWNELSLWTTDKKMEAAQLIFTPSGTLWASIDFPGGIGQYDGKTWKLYPGTNLWPVGPDSGIRIASDSTGNIFGIAEGQKWIVRISKDGSVSRIPFDYSDLEFNSALLSLFVDRQEAIWINACLRNNRNACLTYYKDNRWVSFVNLPFSIVTDINELFDGTLLVATSQGLYQYKSTK